jgi:hypothetical protein
MNENIGLVVMGISMYCFAWFQAWFMWGKKLKELK